MIFRGQRVLTPEGLKPASIHVTDGRIETVSGYDDVTAGAHIIDAGNDLLTPGIVDSHVHINEPGRTEWEGFRTATQAAAAGGITTVVDMPLNCIPATTSRAAAEEKLAALKDQLQIDVAFWGGVVPGNLSELEGLARFGVPGAKCFLCPSGVDEFPHVGRAELDAALPVLRDLGLTLLVHAEAPGPLEKAEAAVAGQDPNAYATYLHSRPRAAEDEAIAMIIELCRKHRAKAHIVHLSSASAIPLLAAAQSDGVQITAETCLHYLAFTAEEITAGATHFKCSPPIREASNRELLWKGLEAGTISMVVSDHSPCTPQLKEGHFMGAWGGIASLQLGLSVLYTLATERGFSLQQIWKWNTEAPAALAGLSGRKGRLARGHDADLVIWDDKATVTVEAQHLRHKHKVSPYIGRTFKGRVKQTYVRGALAWPSVEPAGTFVKKS
ncbi:MAG: allantoinase AllB [Myxococcaceae bacterium]|nr:allantoinase AllB [Myxococcaceae bacterium]